MNKDEYENGIDDISEDIEDIAQDTDDILDSLSGQLYIITEMVGELVKTKRAVWIVILLWIIDKIVMAGLIQWFS